MSCKKWEQQIYLYDELSASEQKQLEDHLLTCESCAATMQIASNGRGLIFEARRAHTQLDNPEMLTRAIMNKIRSGVENKSQSIFSVILDHVFTRYAFAAASFLMVFFFFMEHTEPDQTKKFMRMPRAAKSEVILNSSSFVKNIRDHQSKKQKISILVESNPRR